MTIITVLATGSAIVTAVYAGTFVADLMDYWKERKNADTEAERIGRIPSVESDEGDAGRSGCQHKGMEC